MNYAKIYNDLIEHRKTLPKLEGVYYERHHIVPRCMGGGDDEENLVYLTAEDHFVAHLLLAKAHGGRLWWAANAMRLPLSGRVIKHRRAFGVIRQEIAELQSDPKEYEFKNIETGEIFTATRLQIQRSCGLSFSETSRLVRGERKIAQGFCLSDTDLSTFEAKQHAFVKISTGEVVKRTVRQMSEEYNITEACLGFLIQGRCNTTHGFSLPGFEISKYKFRNLVTGEVIERTSAEMFEEFGVQRSAISNLMYGKILTTKGFCLPHHDNESVAREKSARRAAR